MKKTSISVLLLLLLTYCQAQTGSTNGSLTYFKTVDSLIHRKDFFVARDFYALHKTKMDPVHQLVTEATIAHVFNQLKTSNEKINQLWGKYKQSLPDSTQYKLLVVKQSNYGKLYQYRDAYVTIREIMATYPHLMTKEEQEEFANTRTIWQALAQQPKQQVAISKNTTLKITRDKAGLLTIPVVAQGDSIGFVFDTGANLSTVTQSMAKRLGMKFMDATIQVGAITGKKVSSRIAVCPEMHLGNIRVRHAVFLVFNDSDLAIPAIDYQINGIIGFPVIEAMKEIQITRRDELMIAQKPTRYHQQNLVFDFLTPVIDLSGESYTFDTGANATILYKAYFTKYRSEIEGKHPEQSLQFGGAGGTVRKPGYIVRFSPVIDGKAVPVDSVKVFKENPKADQDHIYGNVGQDLIKKFDEVILNFESMFIRFQ